MRQTGSEYQRAYWLCLLIQLLKISIFSEIDHDHDHDVHHPVGLYVSASTTVRSSNSVHLDRSLYYQRYGSYPSYCSDPGEMATRKIPPLPKDGNDNGNGTRLVHVTAIIRHGARTPVHKKNCWQGHWDEPDGIWDCQLKTVLSTRPDNKGEFLVEKIYDAFLGEKVPSPYRNRMNGTCQDGQLIQQGYDQQRSNGRYLRDAYVYDDNSDSDPRLSLFTASSLNAFQGNKDDGNYNFLGGALRYRSDDDQRTLASGQILLSSMFGPEVVNYRNTHNGANPIITHHTADKPNDIMSSKRGKTTCPSQEAMIDRSYKSDEYSAFSKSEESMLMRQLIENELEPEGGNFGGIDCLMTSICTDRGLPDILNDYRVGGDQDQYTKKYGSDRFERLLNYVRTSFLGVFFFDLNYYLHATVLVPISPSSSVYCYLSIRCSSVSYRRSLLPFPTHLSRRSLKIQHSLVASMTQNYPKWTWDLFGPKSWTA
mmetsp:Transcript_6951/g.14781  ORF Transcript_6951/g.14781 Transcript_6951/m.14781 type:complete len:482 (-) Transcript_6951:667-2112(-)